MNNTQKLDIIERVVCSNMHIDLKTHRKHYHSRQMPYIDARCIVNTIAKSLGMSLTFIGEYSGGKTHATIYNSIKICNNLCATDKEFELKFKVCRQAVNSALNGDTIQYHVFTTDELLKFINDLNQYHGVVNNLEQHLKNCNLSDVSNNGVVVCPSCDSDNCAIINIPLHRCNDCGTEWHT